MFDPTAFYAMLSADNIPALRFVELHDLCDPNAYLAQLLGEYSEDEYNAAAANWDKFVSLIEMCKGDDPVCLLDGNRGIYIPAIFCQLFGVDIPECSNPDNDGYWDFWEDLSDNFGIKVDGKNWYLYQDGDLWLTPETYDWEN